MIEVDNADYWIRVQIDRLLSGHLGPVRLMCYCLFVSLVRLVSLRRLIIIGQRSERFGDKSQRSCENPKKK
jgi:hypothetical protein